MAFTVAIASAGGRSILSDACSPVGLTCPRVGPSRHLYGRLELAENATPPRGLDVLANRVEADLHLRLDWAMAHLVGHGLSRAEIRQPAPRGSLERVEHLLRLPAELLAHSNEVLGTPRGRGIERRPLAGRRGDSPLSHRPPSLEPSSDVPHGRPKVEPDPTAPDASGGLDDVSGSMGVRRPAPGRRWRRSRTFRADPPRTPPRFRAAFRSGCPRC